MRIILASIALVAVSTAAIAGEALKPVYIHNGFLTGNQYRQLPDVVRRAYVMGVTDGMLLAPAMANRDLNASQRFGKCLDNMHATNEQLTVIVDRWVDGNPVRWGDTVHMLIWSAFSEACSTAGMPLF
jgi:hypothetical protein